MPSKRKSFKADDSDDDFDLTPMIDIVFLLIAFFMVVAKLIDDSKVEIAVPFADQSKISKESPHRMTMTVDASGKAYWGAEKLGTPADLTRFVKSALRAKGEHLEIYVRADARTPFKHVRDVMKAIAEGGVFDVKFAAYENN